jgi:hypothetical protein
MKIRTLLAPIIVGLLAHIVAADAADWYAVTLRGTCRSVTGEDRIGRRSFNNTTIIRDHIATQEVAVAARTLKVAYDPEADKISIVDTNGVSVQDIFSFGFPTVVSNSTETQMERHVFLFTDGSEAVGTAQMTERIVRDTEGAISRLTVRGNLQFANSATADTSAEVCSGTFTVGRKLRIVVTEPEPEPVAE